MTLSLGLLWNYWSIYHETWYIERTSYGVMHIGRKFWSPHFFGGYAPWNFENIRKSTNNLSFLWQFFINEITASDAGPDIIRSHLLKKNRFYSFNHRCECLYYISIRLWAIIIVDYPFLSTIYFNRGRLTWNSQRLAKDFLHVIRNIQGQHHSWSVIFTCNWHDLEPYMHGFLHMKCVSLLIIHCDVTWYHVE